MTQYGNGSTPVTRYELGLALDPLRHDLRALQTSIDILGTDVHTFKVLAESRSFLGARGRGVVNGLFVALPAAVVSVAISLLLTH